MIEIELRVYCDGCGDLLDEHYTIYNCYGDESTYSSVIEDYDPQKNDEYFKCYCSPEHFLMYKNERVKYIQNRIKEYTKKNYTNRNWSTYLNNLKYELKKLRQEIKEYEDNLNETTQTNCMKGE